MQKDTVLKIEGLYKKFCRTLKRSMFYGSIDIAKSMLGIPYNSDNLRKNEFWALENINLELRKGDTLGIIGQNGSGKTTLLRLINGIFPPDKGRITIRGKVGALISIGAGFHPHMTGRENIYLNGTILGMSRKELNKKLDSIIDFADIGDFLDSPVSTYSSGMTVRLGFAIAIHCEPDILIVDEILSVGDINFRNKSLRKMSEYREKANAIIFVSHNLEQVRILCNEVIILDRGKIIFTGSTHEGIVQYQELSRDIRLANFRKPKTNSEIIISRWEGEENGCVEILDIGVCNNENDKINAIEMNSSLNLYCSFNLKKAVKGLFFSFSALNEEYKPCIWVMSNDNNKKSFNNLGCGRYRLLLKINNHHLIPGIYIPNIAIRDSTSGETYERLLPENSFKVKSNGVTLERGIVDVEADWFIMNLS